MEVREKRKESVRMDRGASATGHNSHVTAR